MQLSSLTCTLLLAAGCWLLVVAGGGWWWWLVMAADEGSADARAFSRTRVAAHHCTPCIHDTAAHSIDLAAAAAHGATAAGAPCFVDAAVDDLRQSLRCRTEHDMRLTG